MGIARKLLDRLPFLHSFAYFLFVRYLKTKNWIMEKLVFWFGYVPRSLSDRGQDRWVIREIFDCKVGGFFLDLGAADGFSDSNTYVLEKRYAWSGICIEPNPILYEQLVNHYKRQCICAPEAVDAQKGTLEFVMHGQLSGLNVSESDIGANQRPDILDAARRNDQVIEVETMPLIELLERYDAPEVIDYFSLDIEGLETRIMRDFDFSRYKFLTLTVERPTPELNEILFANGYYFVKNSLYDSFYIHESLPNFDDVPRKPFEQLPSKRF